MNSQCFIRDARSLMERITKTNALPEGDSKDNRRKQNQQDLEYLCNNMSNPSLPTAYKLVVYAHRQKYNVDPRVFHKVNQFA
jgi:hypothetical protein